MIVARLDQRVDRNFAWIMGKDRLRCVLEDAHRNLDLLKLRYHFCCQKGSDVFKRLPRHFRCDFVDSLRDVIVHFAELALHQIVKVSNSAENFLTVRAIIW